MVKKLTKDDAEKIVNDRTFFKKTFNVETGEELTLNDDGVFVSSDSALVPKELQIEINYNKTVKKRIKKYASVLLGMRGIKDIESISSSDPEVVDQMKKYKKRVEKQENKRFIESSELKARENAAIEGVKRVHKPQYLIAMLQLISWAILKDDLFTIRGGAVEYDFDLEIPEDYWSSKLSKEEDVDSDIDALINGLVIQELQFDRTNPFEFLIGITNAFTEKYDKLAENMSSLIQMVFVNLTVLNGDQNFDEAGFLHAKLDELLSEDVTTEDDA